MRMSPMRLSETAMLWLATQGCNIVSLQASSATRQFFPCADIFTSKLLVPASSSNAILAFRRHR